ncbi:hypothetical protein E3N88_43189 [Mikania micrantha]|uniref:Uncharacterized protein n=1 Tax=Mikania micrantha TaxID=192012 RepID=A0A5N6LFS0_9ASTR|nr:hypothetical protein E3N88_43189 [Mikania micrantha]
MQSNLDSLSGKIDLNLRDCGLLIKTGFLVRLPCHQMLKVQVIEAVIFGNYLLGWQIGHLEAKHKALDSLVDVMKEDEKTVLSIVGRANIGALVGPVVFWLIRWPVASGARGCSITEFGRVGLSRVSDLTRAAPKTGPRAKVWVSRGPKGCHVSNCRICNTTIEVKRLWVVKAGAYRY